MKLFFQPPKQKISDPEELADYQHRKRRAFEDNIRKNRSVINNWIKYAQWEESQKEVPRYDHNYHILKKKTTISLSRIFFNGLASNNNELTLQRETHCLIKPIKLLNKLFYFTLKSI